MKTIIKIENGFLVVSDIGKNGYVEQRTSVSLDTLISLGMIRIKDSCNYTLIEKVLNDK